MLRRILRDALMFCAVLLVGCPRNEPPAPSRPAAPPPQAQVPDPEPHWVVQQKPQAKVAIVYVHGVIGDMIDTWTAPNGKHFWDLMNENEATKGQADALVYGFPSHLFKGGSFDIREAVNRLHERLVYHRVLNYPTVVFVAHSMGGLIVLQELLTHRDVMEKVPVVMFYATPMEGSLVAAVGKMFSPNTALAQMTPADGNTLLQSLNDQWKSVPDDKRPHVRCAYEKLPIGPALVVPWSSATRFCEGATPAVEATHTGIVKPDHQGADSIVYLVNALNEYVLGHNLDVKLETPDFVAEGDRSVFVLTAAVGRQPARLVNAGGGKIRYTLAEFSDPGLLLWPDTTPKEIAKNSTDVMHICTASGASKKEYQFTLRVDTLPDKRVIVRIPDPAALDAQHAQLAAGVFEQIQNVLSNPIQFVNFKNVPTDDKAVPGEILKIARAELARQSPDLPESAQWVLTADLLNSLNWPSLAAQALQNAERASPAVVRMPGVQHLAALVASQAGEHKVFTDPAAIYSWADVKEWKASQPLLATQANRLLGLDVAQRMIEVPSLKVFGLSLQGDVQQVQGDAHAAHVSFEEATTIKPTPSLSTRIQATDFASGYKMEMREKPER